MSILDKIATVSDRPPPLRACIFGPPGAGKTVLSAGAPKPLLLDVEGGARSLMNHPGLKDTAVLPIQSYTDVEDVIWEFRQDESLKETHETIIIDTGTELQAMLLSEILKEKNKKDSSRNAYAAQQLDYKENTEMLRRLVVALRDLQMHVIIVAHSIEDKDESDGRIYTRPGFTPKLAGTIKGLMDVQGYLTADVTKEGERKQFLQVHPANNVQAKCRVGGLPVVIENPDINMLIKANQEETENGS
jgi:phage nucleotide-binding protein